METFDGHDEFTLPEVYKYFSVIVATGAVQEGAQDQFHVHTNWGDSNRSLDMFWAPDVPFTVKPMQLKKLADYSRARLRDFLQKLVDERDCLHKVALELQNEEIKYRREKQAAYAASQRTLHSNVQQPEQAMKSVRLNDSTDTMTMSNSRSSGSYVSDL
ncbi:hypothetical protein ARMSODRAFT_1011612 [Armillaria solidipes]|uniref:Uncharacterized protein n=1 Tax=Armillaria solidipes TaxID=1076256 RepID=A0A2H3CHV3_9AGAR|nr:hypothetical protein ARMSODRAFT_1011612 [Armillaria solidipes]